jgi:dihydrofolate reductase
MPLQPEAVTPSRFVAANSWAGERRGRESKSKEADVRKLIVQEFMTMDGVVQAPGGKDEDRTGGFEHGGWSMPYFDDASMKWVVDNLNEAGGFVLGRRTYEIFAGHWPEAPEEEQPLAKPLNRKPKFVATETLTEPLEWENSTVLQGDVAKAVAALKKEDGGDLLVIGSAELVKSLVEDDLVDEFRMMIDPLVVGGGKRLFREDGALNELKLVDSEATETGAILATYAAAKA